MSQTGRYDDLLGIPEALPIAEDMEEDRGNKKRNRGVRRRVAQACDRCRVRKDKCEAQKPVCSNCAENGRHCSYDMVAKKRGLPEGYVRGLEKLWGLAIQEVQDVEDSILLALDGSDGETKDFNWDDRKTSDTLVESWRKSHLSRELGKLLSDKGSMMESAKRTCLDSEPLPAKRLRIDQQLPEIHTSKQNGSRDTVRNRMSAKPECSSPTSRDSPIPSLLEENLITSTSYKSILQPSYTQWGTSNSTSSAITTLPDLPSETWHLLDVYFSYTHAWLPILVKHDVLRTSYQYSQSQHTVFTRGSGAGEYAALWAAIALAKFQHRAINNIPLAQGPIAEMVWTAERMYNQARSMIPNEEGDLDLGHVQALLILAVANMGIGNFSRSWSLVGQAVRLALDLELNKPFDHVLTASKHKSIVRYVFFGCFTLDTILAARLGRRPHLRFDDMEIVGYVEEDGLEEWDPWTDSLNVRRGSSTNFRGPAALASTFNRLLQVLQILNQAICLPVSSETSSTRASLLKKLHTWNQTQQSPIPSTSYGKQSTQTAFLLPHQYHLYSAYFATLSTIYLLGRNSGDVENMERCSNAARDVVEIFNQHASSFSLVIAPPSFEFFAKVAYDAIDAIKSTFGHDHITVDNWKHNLDHCLDAMIPAWPVFSLLKERYLREAQHLARTESQVAYELMTGGQRSPGSDEAAQKHRGSISIEATRQSHARGVTQLTRSRNVLNGDPGKASEVLQQISQQILPVAWSVSPNNQLPRPPRQQRPQPNNHGHLPGAPLTGSKLQISQTSKAVPQPIDPQTLQSSPSNSNSNADPLFNEFAALDAVEWTDNWDNVLVNLGFNDPDNMNHDFITMIKEHELPNDIFQQLVTGSGEEAVGALDASESSTRGLIRGRGGFEMFDFGDENEGYEAGQILQSLSVAGELELFRNLGG